MSRFASSEDKIHDPARGDVARWIADFPRPLVFTNGCFDLLHRGHVAYLEQAAALGESLIVGVNDDASARAQGKRPPRPVTPLADRMALLAALAAVDGVVAFAAPTPLALIERIAPDHLVKGGDWPPERIVGAEQVIARGGEVHSLPFRFQRSTSELIERIRSV
ncbi:MAG: adenylyltransferase/cytidyltransferase family protein [bacterium]